jgi:hypothetical protein
VVHDLLDGGRDTESGAPRVYEGMQGWLDTEMIYHPSNRRRAYGRTASRRSLDCSMRP